MTDKEKLLKLEKLADAMYYAATNLGSNVGSGERLRKTMEDYHKFIIHEYHKEKPVSEDLEVATQECIESLIPERELNSATPFSLEYVIELLNRAFKISAQWQKEQITKNAIDATVKVDAGGYPYIHRTIELYDYDKDEPLAKAGDKVKILVIKD